jgi:hypothetical protein
MLPSGHLAETTDGELEGAGVGVWGTTCFESMFPKSTFTKELSPVPEPPPAMICGTSGKPDVDKALAISIEA